MAVASAMLCAYFCALLPAIAAESGLGESLGSGACADAELDTNFTCVVRMPVFQINILICNITVIEMNMNNVGFTVYGEHTRACSMENQLQGNCPIDNDELLQPVEVCLVTTLMKQQCKECHNVIAVHIIKPEAPFNLQITYQEEANEYYINFSTPHSGPYLENKLIHELAYRQRNTIWTTRESEYLTLTLLAKEFQPGATYEMKVRSKPNGNYFKGTWSEWSSAKSFKTASRMPVEINNNNNVIMMTATVLCFLVLLIVISLIPIFWKNRIKPAMWPTLPNHKKTLDKLCNKLRKLPLPYALKMYSSRFANSLEQNLGVRGG
ncbi:interleukin-7 receptor subunit alpha isoform X2 [Rhineura floridana]|uniref:interleukin-7 receptor subunit alpha isoform X2 n=1 Tax=Rhineura floridana TaxID=261503 RepID=UPI002AC83A02|nr:interleukin-7 receptor subunit alpha isoform X2 [Rhineura floridana]